MTAYLTQVIEYPASPLGLLGACWKVEHWCRTCRQRVATEDLVEHAQLHAAKHDSSAEEIAADPHP